MGFPKQIKKTLDLTPHRTLYPRRVELLDKINEHGTFLPKSILHADLDRGFLDFVRDELQLVSEGHIVPNIDIIITTQNWAQFTQTWNFQDLDKNVKPPFISVVKSPEMKYGSLPSLNYTIPNRKQFYYASVPSFDGDRMGIDVYTIPQPVPIDIKYTVKIICNRMRELNAFNKIILQKFTSRQAYQVIKGHYIPIIMDGVSDDGSSFEIEKRKYYIQSYDFTMMGFLLDEEEFKVAPAIERVLQLVEVPVNGKKSKKVPKTQDTNTYNTFIDYASGSTSESKTFYDNVNLDWISSDNVSTFDVYINTIYYGSNITHIKVNGGDVIRFDITKTIPSTPSKLHFTSTIV